MPRISKHKNNDSHLASSPLLGSEISGRSLHSTINPDRLDPARFSEMKDDSEDSPFRIILYVVVVIIIGVGSAFGVRQLISKNDSDGDSDSSSSSSSTLSEDQVVKISTTQLADTQATNAAQNSQFVDSAQVSIGVSDADPATVSVDEMEYRKFTTFVRLSYTLSGLKDAKFPQTGLTFDSIGKKITVDMSKVPEFAEELQTDITVNDLIKEVRFNEVNKEFIVFFSEDIRYRAVVSGDQLILDVKTTKQYELDLSSSSSSSSTSSQSVSSTASSNSTAQSSSTNIGGTNLDNDFSQGEQFVVSSVSGNTIGQNIFYYEDAGPYFEFSFGTNNKVGEQFIPNSSAKIVEEGGVFYIELKVQNLETETFAQYGISGTSLSASGVDLSAANFVRIDRTGFANGVATYRIKLKYKSDYKLYAQPTIDGKTQVISIQIKD